ncbi:MAG: hypothetical protein OXQ90_08620 [Gammaproteobacteria bacterium]|nr:hypothetical protein [Gammaproteobacteria bacterium]
MTMMMTKRVVAGLSCALACGTPAADPVEEYRQACETPHFEALSVETHPFDRRPIDWAVAEKSCWQFIQRLEADPAAPPDETRLALYLAKAWLGGYSEDEERCAEVGAIVERLPDNADALFQWAYCVDDSRIALLKEVAEMGHPEARSHLLSSVGHTGDYYGIPPKTLAGYADEMYENAKYASRRYEAAVFAYKIAVDTGDRDAAKAVQTRLVRDHGLDSLDYAPPHRGESLDRACGVHIFVMDLEQDLCIPALEALAAEATSAGEAIPPDVLLHMEDAFKRFEYGTWSNGPKPLGTARLAAILDFYPEPLRSSEHLRVRAKTKGGADRIAGLRRAVDTDPGNLRARCDLAEAMVFAGSVDEAASLYKGLIAAEDAPCRPSEALGQLPERTAGNTTVMETITVY